MMIDLDEAPTQALFARIVGVDRSRVSVLVADGTLPADATLGDLLLAYCNRLREQAAGRASDGPLDLAQERAALARSQRASVDMRNAVQRGEYAPIQLLAEVLSTASAAVGERLDALPGLLAKACPAIGAEDRKVIAGAITEARNAWAAQTAALVVDRLNDGEDEDDDAPASEADGGQP